MATSISKWPRIPTTASYPGAGWGRCGGGNDLLFPHHENEIAQTESLTGKPFVRYWLHNGMMQLRGEDMSKSTGVMLTVDEFLSRHEADELRMMVLNSQYRKPLTYTETSAEAGRGALQ